MEIGHEIEILWIVCVDFWSQSHKFVKSIFLELVLSTSGSHQSKVAEFSIDSFGFWNKGQKGIKSGFMIDFVNSFISISQAFHQYRIRMVSGIFDAARRIPTAPDVPTRPQTKTRRPDATRLAHFVAHQASPL